MTAGKTISAKIMRPGLSGVIQRKRLFRILAERMEKPILWISSPAGSGKTKLISSYLDFCKLPGIWYQCDEGDLDLATFFYYMGLAAKKAAPRYRKPLPLLTPEYLAVIPAFTRRYFEELYGRLVRRRTARGVRHGFFIVLDNYQDVPANSGFHDMIANGLDVIPEGIHVVVISRGEPPPALTRLQASDKIEPVRYSDVRFTFEESMELAHERIPHLDNPTIQAMHEKTQGWAAGITLMLERGVIGETGAESAVDFTYERVFDYFAGEIFNRMEKGVQDFLLKTAFLPALNVPLAEKLTGVDMASRILASLNRHHFFTEKLSGSEQDYQYHPLFRDFLLSRAKTLLPSHELTAVRKDAAGLLEQAGQIEDAARLYRDTADRDGLARMVIDHARELLGQGRNKTLEEWIAGIPDEPGSDNPWLLYWNGMCFFPLDMLRARKYLEKAFELFKAKKDTSGIYLSWAGIVDTFAFDFGKWKDLDGCITIFEDLRRAYPSFPSQEIELIASSRMLISLTLRNTDQPERVEGWLAHVSALLTENPSFDIQMDTVFCMNLYYLWKGEYNRNAVLLEKAEADIRYRQPSPFVVIRLKMMQGIHYWITAQYDSALHTLSEGLAISNKSGVRVFDSMLWSFRAAAEMAPGHLEQAERSLQNQMASLLTTNKTLDIFFYHINSAWYAMLKGNPSLAEGHMETISAQVIKLKTPYYRALWHIGMAQVLFLQDRTREGKTHIHTARQISLGMKSQVMEWYSLLIDAWSLFQESREEEGLGSLSRALALGKRHGYVHLEFYQPAMMQFLYARALAEGTEPEYVKGLIRKLGLAPPAPHDAAASAAFFEDWPYPIKIFTLGRFEILKDDEPLVFAGKAQKKPLEMVKALIAAGGTNVSAELLTDALWPDAEGDLAHKSFEMTLSRLRRLLGGEDIVRYSAGQLSIDPLYCRVDSLVLTHLIGEIRKTPDHEMINLCEKAIHLYQGSFLPSDATLAWAVHQRETLKNGMLRIIMTTGHHYEQAGDWERAADYYLKGLEEDDLAEEFYQRLMVCYQKLGNHAGAVKTYKQCCRLLQDHLGIRPSAATEAVYSSIIQKR